jgi:hypothetical protein
MDETQAILSIKYAAAQLNLRTRLRGLTAAEQAAHFGISQLALGRPGKARPTLACCDFYGTT